MTSQPSLAHLARPAAAVFAALFAIVVLAGCGGAATASDLPASAPPAATPGASIFDPGGLVAAIADADGTTVTVDGFLLIAGDQAQLCGIVMESYPPQCGGPTIRVLGEVPRDVLDAMDSTSEPDLGPASWGNVRITGTVDAAAGTPTITISSIEVAPPA